MADKNDCENNNNFDCENDIIENSFYHSSLFKSVNEGNVHQIDEILSEHFDNIIVKSTSFQEHDS